MEPKAEKSEIVLGRVGHYHVPGSGDGSCQTAIVSHVGMGSGDVREHVNLGGWEHDGETFRRLDVPVVAPGDTSGHSFHLTRNCPLGK